MKRSEINLIFKFVFLVTLTLKGLDFIYRNITKTDSIEIFDNQLEKTKDIEFSILLFKACILSNIYTSEKLRVKKHVFFYQDKEYIKEVFHIVTPPPQNKTKDFQIN